MNQRFNFLPEEKSSFHAMERRLFFYIFPIYINVLLVKRGHFNHP